MNIYPALQPQIILPRCRRARPATNLLPSPILCIVSEVKYTAEIISKPEGWTYTYYIAYKQLGAGLCCGMSSLAAGLCIGVVGDAGVRGNAQRDILIALILMMIFAEALALYGFIVAIVLSAS